METVCRRDPLRRLNATHHADKEEVAAWLPHQGRADSAHATRRFVPCLHHGWTSLRLFSATRQELLKEKRLFHLQRGPQTLGEQGAGERPSRPGERAG